VPFLTEGLLAGVINIQTDIGAAGGGQRRLAGHDWLGSASC
jgi:hypothetical protein